MTINEYQTAALRTAQTDKLSASDLLLNSALGLCGESGEVADLVKKHLFQGHDLDLNHVAKELGDISWYLAVGAYAIGLDLESIFRINKEKLEARYPDGFSADRSNVAQLNSLPYDGETLKALSDEAQRERRML